VLARARGVSRSEDEAREWKADTFAELYEEDRLWAYSIRVSDELEFLRGRMKDNVLYDLLKTGVMDWKSPHNRQYAQLKIGMRHSTAMVSRLVPWIKEVEDKVRSHSTS
jgi:hypothetical protein